MTVLYIFPNSQVALCCYIRWFMEQPTVVSVDRCMVLLYRWSLRQVSLHTYINYVMAEACISVQHSQKYNCEYLVNT